MEFASILSYYGMPVYVPNCVSVGDGCAMREDYHSSVGSVMRHASTSGPTSTQFHATKDDYILDAMPNVVVWLLWHDRIHPREGLTSYGSDQNPGRD